MSDTAYGVNAPEAVKLWSRKLAREALKKTYIKSFMSNSSDSLIQIKSETKKSEGDRIRVTLRMQLTGAGVQGDGPLEGNEEGLTTYTDDFVINQLRHAVRSEGKMTEQRIPFSIRSESMMGLSDWWADRWDTWAFNHMGGYTPQNDTRFSGHNAILAPSAGRQVWPNAVTTDQGLNAAAGVTDNFTLTLIDKAVEIAKTGTPPIRPIVIDGEKWFVVFLHPFQVTSLRTNVSASSVTWYDIQSKAISGGKIEKNPIFTGALGTYNGCILHESVRVPQGVSSVAALTPVTTARRAILCGAQALICGFGQQSDEGDYEWFEQLFDYGNKLGVKAGCISGLKKSVFNSIDFGTVVMSSKALQGNV